MTDWFFERKIVNIFLPISFNKCFGCSKEPSQWDGSFEYPQHMFSFWNKKMHSLPKAWIYTWFLLKPCFGPLKIINNEFGSQVLVAIEFVFIKANARCKELVNNNSAVLCGRALVSSLYKQFKSAAYPLILLIFFYITESQQVSDL